MKSLLKYFISIYYNSSIFKKVSESNFYQKRLLKIHKKKWKENNSHNFTSLNCIDYGIVKVGNYTYGPINYQFFNNIEEQIEIGNFCSIASGVVFLTGGEHPLYNLSTYPFEAKFCDKIKSDTQGKIKICDDVWIGNGCTILSGVTIGQGAVIGAGTTVAKDIPPYAIFAGGRIIKYRFDEKTIHKLLLFDYGKLNQKEILENLPLLNSKISDEFFKSDFYLTHLR